MTLTMAQVREILDKMRLDTTVFYSKKRGLKFLYYPIYGMDWNETFVMLDENANKVGLIVAHDKKFEVYAFDQERADDFVNNIPATWDDYVCVGVCVE